MAPERRSGSAGGPAADQYSFCATAWEALFGVLPETTASERRPSSWSRSKLPTNGCPDAIVDVLRRGLAERPEARWPSMDTLCSALERARDRQARISDRARGALVAGLSISMALGVVGLAFVDGEDPSLTCERLGRAARAGWGPEQRAVLEVRFATSPLPLPRSEGRFVIDRLDAWMDDWSAMWTPACVAEPRVRRCLEQEHERLETVLALLEREPGADDLEPLGAARALVTELGSPTLCLDANRGPSLDVDGIERLAELSVFERRIELAVLAGAHERAAAELQRFDAALAELEAAVEPTELALHRLAVEPLRARVLTATNQTELARARLRDAIREAEARGHDGLRFALLLEQSRLAASLLAETIAGGAGWTQSPRATLSSEPPTLDDLAALDGLAERVDAGPIARAELSLIRAGLSLGGQAPGDHAQLVAELEAASEALVSAHPQGYAELRLELALRRAQLHFDAGELVAASRAAEQAWLIGESSPERSGPRVWTALTIKGISAALLGDCDRALSTVGDLWRIAEESDVELAVRREALHGMTDAIDWASVSRTCPYEGTDLRALLAP
jgi:hypothetical protein